MIAVIQRVSNASVKIANEKISQINTGLVILLGVMETDEAQDVVYLADKIAHFRIFPDEEDKMNRDILEIQGECLVISQFTLCANWLKGRRPSFTKAASPEKGEKFYTFFCKELHQAGISVKTGYFGAKMSVSLVNEGPVTFILDSQKKIPHI
ncbi:MAG: D-aminoacyl-tRNA deacylase [Candidatus Marinimicrobia bacterium]|nr:D-aminoacyl-tRNA deacylase [Candidatus Neomarinimicrobiota bacterium]MDD5582714.1 D-aminoacyl-tRNA deacylase [Candidatus Neomarinimicrobiota bacterium]